jgi:nucleotide-binding universal stress UspA family protein
VTTPYQRILCPIDFSDISRTALAWSLELARELESELTVLHAVDSALVNVGNLVAIPGGVDELRKQAQREIDALSEGLDLSSSKLLVEEGAPANVIVSVAEKSDYDLVVMGTHGLSGLQKLLLGSVMEKVLHRVKAPLLCFSARMANEERAPKKILLAVDFGPETAGVIRHGVWLAEHFGAKLLAAHAVSVPYVVLNDRSMERLTPDQLERLKDTLTAERREELVGLFPESTASLEIISTVGSAYRAMLDAVEQHDVDLVVMGRGGHGQRNLGWVGSTCHKMVRSAPCPVLIVGK